MADYGIFVAKFLTVVGGLALVAGALAAFVFNRSRGTPPGQIEVRSLNDKLMGMGHVLDKAILSPKQFKEKRKADKKERQIQAAAESAKRRKRTFVCRFDGDARASAVASLREEITAILMVADHGDEIVALIESAGGTVHGYGLAASQLQRIRDRGIRLVAAVDKIAASGGYMMACVADRIIAAPFAIIGSIGVIAQIPNFHRLLKKNDIDFEQIMAGPYKRTLTLFGENTDKDREKFREEVEDAHTLFKDFVAENRPQVIIDSVATGEHWFAKRALSLKLVDELRTSDDYLTEVIKNRDVFEVKCTRRKSIFERLFGPLAHRDSTN